MVLGFIEDRDNGKKTLQSRDRRDAHVLGRARKERCLRVRFGTSESSSSRICVRRAQRQARDRDGGKRVVCGETEHELGIGINQRKRRGKDVEG